MRKWLRFRIGTPDFDEKKNAGAAFDKTPIATMKGIVAFDIHWADATGHLDLWDTIQFSAEYKATASYWTAATRISLWQAKE